ncbi:hypothetical protein PHLCEN_2v7718 [Hermanssonia centrifuga]|uniref:Uncharacterized protein n=1 Tax=Hermanssonia centrifuga TaxID=98765 RepID=A0A2R6NVW2_9APHY|nr:hypothetical protein PHLCEN_2v7718 [Hermanssonia centrifuga]
MSSVHPRTLEAVPKEFRSFYHPSIRRIYLSGVPIDPDEEEAVEKIQKELELESLRASVSQAHEREHATQSQVRSLWNSWTQEKTKNAELQQQLAAAIERERVAKEELRRYEAELRLKRENHSLPSMSSQDPHLGSMFDFQDNDSGYLGVTGAPSYQGFQHWASLASQNNFPK